MFISIIWAPATVLCTISIRLNFITISIYVKLFPTCFDRKDDIQGQLSTTTKVNPSKGLQYNHYRINTLVYDKTCEYFYAKVCIENVKRN